MTFKRDTEKEAYLAEDIELVSKWCHMPFFCWLNI